jgi:hypothetical protein
MIQIEVDTAAHSLPLAGQCSLLLALLQKQGAALQQLVSSTTTVAESVLGVSCLGLQMPSKRARYKLFHLQ